MNCWGITMVKIAIFASGSGSNFENIVDHVESGKLENIEVTALYTDHQNAFCIDRAKSTIYLCILMNQNNLIQKAYEQHLVTLLNKDKVEWIILAGYMRLIGPDLLASFEGKILNIHPSLLPKYKGIDAIGQAYHSGDTITGSTVHYVDSGMDTGEIIEQRQCDIRPDDSKEQLEEK